MESRALHGLNRDARRVGIHRGEPQRGGIPEPDRFNGVGYTRSASGAADRTVIFIP